MKDLKKRLVIRESRADRIAPDGTPLLRIGWESEAGSPMEPGVFASTAQFMEAAERFCDETLAEQEEERKLYRVMTRGRDVYVIACDAIAAITEVEKHVGPSSHYSVTEVDRDVFFADC